MKSSDPIKGGFEQETSAFGAIKLVEAFQLMFPYQLPYLLKPEDQLFFLHIPKTAGTTLISLLDQHFSPDKICPEQLQDNLKKISASDMARYRFFRGHLDYDLYKLLPQKPVYITMLRNPLKRVVSLYKFWKRNREAEYVFREAASSDLYHFVCNPEHIIRLEVENNQTRRIVSNAKDPLDYLTDQESLEVAKKRIAEEFMFFGLVEKFDESMNLLCYSLGWPPVSDYQKQMVAPKQTTIEDLPVKTRDAILERNQLDIALYEFAWGLFHERYHAMVRQLVEKSYQEHFVQWNYSGERVEITADHFTNGVGWYQAEIAPDGRKFRWLGPRNEAILDVSLPRNCNLAITIDIVNSIHPTLLGGHKLYVNGIEVPLTKVSGNEHRGIFQGTIMQQVVDLNPSLTRLEFRVNRTFSPQELFPNSLDTRQVSLAVHAVKVEPITLDTELKEKEETKSFLNRLSKRLRR